VRRIFFQAEDGIRDRNVTGVQTCALPILVRPSSNLLTLRDLDVERGEGDLNNFESLRRACEGVKIVYQAASYYPPHSIPAGTAKIGRASCREREERSGAEARGDAKDLTKG